jgi:antirestriction protein ArdC
MRRPTEETEHEIHYMKGYTVFNVEQFEGLPAHYYAKPGPALVRYSGSSMRKTSS